MSGKSSVLPDFFSQDEIDIAVELVTERLEKGIESGYHFIFAEIDGKTIGYSCFGPIPATQESYDLYWIAVHNDYRGAGIGKQLLTISEEAIHRLGGGRVYIETSGRDQYVYLRAPSICVVRTRKMPFSMISMRPVTPSTFTSRKSNQFT
ncbi:MAG: GNAT family N-acetyltransferase [bacterium]